VGRIVTWVGVLLVLFFVHQFWMSAISESRYQQLLLGQLRQDARAAGGAGGVTSGQQSGVLSGNEGRTTGSAPAKSKAQREPQPPRPAHPATPTPLPALRPQRAPAPGT